MVPFTDFFTFYHIFLSYIRTKSPVFKRSNAMYAIKFILNRLYYKLFCVIIIVILSQFIVKYYQLIMITNYPKQLECHTTPFYTINDVAAFSQGYAYYHNRTYPILMHAHDYYELNVLTKGECIHYFNNKNHRAKAGDVFMIPPYSEHGYWTNDPDTRLFHLIINNSVLEDYKKQLDNYPGIKILLEVEPQIRQAFNNLSLNINIPDDLLADFVSDFNELIAVDKQNYDDGKTMFGLKTVCLLCKLAKMISEIYDATSGNSPNTADYVILKTTQYMEENYASKITVDQLSKIVNMSTPNFFRYFKKVFNTSPMEYLKKIRISHATNMLSTTDKSISFIAQECGFFDSSHFTHVFEQSMNMKPKQVRQRSHLDSSD